jgi:6-phosphofructo-2-kinase
MAWDQLPATRRSLRCLEVRDCKYIPFQNKGLQWRRIAKKHASGTSTPRTKPTTLDIPGLTSSKVSPDGRIADRDVGSKLIIIMVGLPARGKSYITKKTARYLNWLQHDTRIFNVGERRRVVGNAPGQSVPALSEVRAAALALMPGLGLPAPMEAEGKPEEREETIDHDANFFDPNNKRAAKIREQVAMDTLNELLDYIISGSGSVGILDATNSTLARRKMIMERIRSVAGEVNVLFIESVCENKELLEANMRLKLSGPDYKGKDPEASLADFRKRVAIYEKNYVPIGEYEEKNNMSYVKMVDVGRKMVTHQIRGFLSAQVIYYLVNFNLAPRQIWITRHGESTDNVAGLIGGDSGLAPKGVKYAKALALFIAKMRDEWEFHQKDKAQHTHLPPRPGDHTPPNPFVPPPGESDEPEEKNFCVWTSMLRRSVQTAEFFDDEEFEVKQMRMLNELYAGDMEGMSFYEMQHKHTAEYNARHANKLSYRYPGQGGEGYLDVINRLRPVIVELERMTDHCLLITHRTVARILLGYFLGLDRDDVAHLNVPLGMLYSLEPVSCE